MTDHQRGDTVLPGSGVVLPSLTRLAEQGVTFTQAFCPSPHCCPSRATFFTGLYPSGHGVWNNVCNPQALSFGPRPGVRLWSEDLAAAGYDLHFCGKWHVSVEEGPADRGWTEHHVSGGKGALHGRTWAQYRQMAASPDPVERGEGQILRPGYGSYRLYGRAEPQPGDHDETVTAAAAEALRTAARNPTRPWCVFAGLIGPHDPYVVPGSCLDLYDPAAVPLPPSYGDRLEDKPGIYRRMREQLFGQLSPREVREGIRHFRAYCTRLDGLVGRLLTALAESGAESETCVVFCSDHGDYVGDHGLFAKGIPCFRGAYHVPAIVRWPAAAARPGTSVDAFVSLADFGPTLLEAAGVEAGRRFTGSSLLPFLQGERPAWRDEMHTQCNGVELYYTQRSVSTVRHKYVFNGFDRDELYDLGADPHEMRNVADEPAYAGVKRELCGRLWRFAEREGDTAINPYITVGLAPHGPAEAFR